MLKSNDLEDELRQLARRPGAQAVGRGRRSNDRRTVRVNGQEVVVVTKPKRAAND